MVVTCKNQIMADHVKLADTFFLRFLGLMGKKELASGEGLLLRNCPSVHCFFMKFPIDAVYLSRDMTVLYTETLEPWKLGKLVKKAAHVLELPAGTARVAAGETVEIRPYMKP